MLRRSKSIGDSAYSTYVAPFISDLATAVENNPAPVKRIGVAVFPGQSGGSQGDLSGPAETRVPLSESAFSTVQAYATDAALSCDDGEAATKLRMPCSGWKFTSTWTALERADEEMYLNSPSVYDSHKKVVVVVTDGAPERNNNQGMDYRRARPTYLTVRKAKELKNKGAVVLGVGYSSKFTGTGDSFGPCHPMCTGYGQEFFEGQGGSGLLSFSGVDNSDPYTGTDGNGEMTLSTFTYESLVSQPPQENVNWCDSSSTSHPSHLALLAEGAKLSL